VLAGSWLARRIHQPGERAKVIWRKDGNIRSSPLGGRKTRLLSLGVAPNQSATHFLLIAADDCTSNLTARAGQSWKKTVLLPKTTLIRMAGYSQYFSALAGVTVPLGCGW
jgi:hypothetical protein